MLPYIAYMDPMGHETSTVSVFPKTPDFVQRKGHHICRPRGRSVFYQHTPWRNRGFRPLSWRNNKNAMDIEEFPEFAQPCTATTKIQKKNVEL